MLSLRTLKNLGVKKYAKIVPSTGLDQMAAWPQGTGVSHTAATWWGLGAAGGQMSCRRRPAQSKAGRETEHIFCAFTLAALAVIHTEKSNDMCSYPALLLRQRMDVGAQDLFLVSIVQESHNGCSAVLSHSLHHRMVQLQRSKQLCCQRGQPKDESWRTIKTFVPFWRWVAGGGDWGNPGMLSLYSEKLMDSSNNTVSAPSLFLTAVQFPHKLGSAWPIFPT